MILTHIKAVLLFLFGGIILLVSEAGAQTVGDTDIEVYTLEGNIRLQSHAYTTTGESQRREPYGGILEANVQYSLLGFSSGLDIYYNTDDSRFRQNMNRIAFNGSWRWIALSAGDVTPAYSNYGVRGTQIRGGELRLTPGNIFFNLSAGRINRAVTEIEDERPRQLAYERWLYAFAFGAGNPSTNNFGLSGFYGRDLQSSFPDALRQSLREEMVGTQILAAENYGLTPKFQLSFFEEAFKIGAETTVSALTRDLNSPKLTVDEAGVPGFLVDMFSPRNSTRVTYAGKAHSMISVDYFSMRAEFERIMPGFESIALRQLRDDQQTLSLYPRFNFFDGRLSLDGTFSISEDNLLGNRLSTQKRNNIGLNTIARITETFTLGGGYSRFEAYSESSESENGQRDHEQVSQIYQLFPSFVIIGDGATHNITLSGIYQEIDVRYPTLDGTMLDESYTITGNVSHGVSFTSGVSLNSSLNYVMGESPGSTFTTIGASLGGGYAFLEGKLNTNLTLTANFNTVESETSFDTITTENSQLNGSFTASYRFTSSTSFQLNLRSQNNSIRQGDGQGFSELEGRFQFQQRF
ncbi:MAG: hypothetical protein JJU37_13980 [Balneolaceae bacterium]|nr:hypothetical protein [Balneolaceae bacterium]